LTLAPGVIMLSAPAGLLNSHLEKELAGGIHNVLFKRRAGVSFRGWAGIAGAGR